MKCQDLADDLALALKNRTWEQIGFATYQMALKSNGYEVTAENTIHHQNALNEANKALWRVLWQAWEAGCLTKRPGKVPQASFDPNKNCTASCKNARGMDCSCGCFGANHSINRLTLFTPKLYKVGVS